MALSTEPLSSVISPLKTKPFAHWGRRCEISAESSRVHADPESFLAGRCDQETRSCESPGDTLVTFNFPDLPNEGCRVVLVAGCQGQVE